jgi:hypothetical protein
MKARYTQKVISSVSQSTELTPSSIEQKKRSCTINPTNGSEERHSIGGEYNERGIAEYNYIHTASRPNFDVSKVRASFAIKHCGPKSVQELNAENMYERWLRVISEGNGASSSAKRRNLAAIL